MIAPEQFNLAEYLLDQRIADGQGDSVALLIEEEVWTYGQVQAAANQAAGWLREHGLGVEQRLLLALPDSLEYVAALFGALKLGAAVVMANPALPAEELQALQAFCRAPVALGPTGTSQSDFRRGWESHAADFVNYPTHRDDIALWLFSGGTTGRPKAVLQSHQSFFNTTELYGKRFMGYTAADRTLSVPKLFFGYATGSNLFFPFSVGASAVLFPEKPTAEVVLRHLQRYQPTLLINVPTLVNHLIEVGAGQDLSFLRACTSAGEALPESLHHKWMETFGVELLDGLGTAEMWHVFLSNAAGDVRPGSLGKAVPGFEVKVCDDEGRELPRGEVGRLWVWGDSRGLCYWQQAEQSQQAFRGRCFAASDLMRQDQDGYFHYCGRADEMLKVAGRWLAPQDVESCLLTHPAVSECAVVGVTCADGLVRPHAFVVSPQAGPDLAEELKAHVLARLEAYKHPRQVIFVDSLPRTHLGKVNRAELRGRP